MKGYSGWSFRPYVEADHYGEEKAPYICQIVPEEKGFVFGWFDRGSAGPHYLNYRFAHTGEAPVRMLCEGEKIAVTGLENGRNYEFWIEREDRSARSRTRLVRCGKAPGITVNYLHPKDTAYSFSGKYLCSPSLVKIGENTYLASMDVFALDAPQNLTLLFRTEDGGQTWRYVCELFPCFWGELFVHRDVLYMLATTTEYGNLVIGCSQDEGYTWSAPVTLIPGAGKSGSRGVHKAPVPVIEHEGRLITAVEYGSWKTGGHAAGLLSIDADSDLMQAGNWRCTGFLRYDPLWAGPSGRPNADRGGLEGNAVISPRGEVLDILRHAAAPAPYDGRALVLEADGKDPEAPLTFRKFMDFNGAHSKFELRQDPVTGTYWALVNEIVYSAAPSARNVLSLAYSADLEHFTIVERVLDYRDCDIDEIGFQYPSFLFDGEDICVLSRTAFNGAAGFHDANQITFHRVRDFRRYIGKDAD